MQYEIDKASSVENFENGCLNPSDGGKYDAQTALNLLESRYGGVMRDNKGRQFGVSSDKSSNQWIRDTLKLK